MCFFLGIIVTIMTQKELSRQSGYSVNSISAWLNPKYTSNIQYKNALVMADLTGIPWEVWVRGEDFQHRTLKELVREL